MGPGRTETSVNTNMSWVWKLTSTISTFRKLKQEDLHKIEGSLGYIERLCQKEENKEGRKEGSKKESEIGAKRGEGKLIATELSKISRDDNFCLFKYAFQELC